MSGKLEMKMRSWLGNKNGNDQIGMGTVRVIHAHLFDEDDDDDDDDDVDNND